MSMKYKIINQVYSTIIKFSYVVQITYIALFTYLKKVYLATFVQVCFHEEVTSNICTMKFKRATQNKDSENYIADFHCLSIYNHVRCCMVISNYYLSIIMLTITVFLCYFRRSSYLVTHIPLAYIYRTIIHKSQNFENSHYSDCNSAEGAINNIFNSNFFMNCFQFS